MAATLYARANLRVVIKEEIILKEVIKRKPHDYFKNKTRVAYILHAR